MKQWFKWVIAPSLFVSDYYKGLATSKSDRGKRVKKLNKFYLRVSIGLTVMISLVDLFTSSIGVMGPLWWGICIYGISRCNEILMAFVRDVFDKLNTKRRDKNGLEYFERIQLALRSYIELVLHYALLYYIMDTYIIKVPLFNQVMNHLWDAIYFSVITIVSIGYGDIYPVHPLSKGLVMYEVINGMLLLAVSFTVYVNLTLDE